MDNSPDTTLPADPASAPPTRQVVPPLLRAANGLRWQFLSAVLTALILLGQEIMRLAELEWEWFLVPACVWMAAVGLALVGRWRCRKAGASIHAKRLLSLSIFLTMLTLLVQLAYLGVLVALVWQQLPMEANPQDPAPINRELLIGTAFVAPVVELLAVAFFLLYLRGLAHALEYSGFANDAMAVVVIALVCAFFLVPLLIGLWWVVCWLIAPLVGNPYDKGWALLLVCLVLLLMWPFLSYCNLLKDLRDAILQRLHEEELQKKPKWPV